ncbi:hypothetical protein TNCV_3869881 [Trichonephila clavipes]|nr:hypothetical protein TNCV_3869881 [Trichonephila clavipes]
MNTGDDKNHENNAARKSISLETKMQVIRRLDIVPSGSSDLSPVEYEWDIIRGQFQRRPQPEIDALVQTDQV